MTVAIKEILALSAKERLEIIDQIWESLNSDEMDQMPVPEEQLVELRRRRAMHKEGNVETYSWDEVKKAIRECKI